MIGAASMRTSTSLAAGRGTGTSASETSSSPLRLTSERSCRAVRSVAVLIAGLLGVNRQCRRGVDPLACGMNIPRSAQALDLLIVGAGFAGLHMLHKARQMGLAARVVDSAPSVGGTWYHNRYPGARVDIQSMEYSFAFSEELQQEWHWSERYASQPELLRYANHVADRFGLRDGISLGTRVTGASFDESARRWEVHGTGGEAWSARFLVMASGALSTPNQPALDGLDSFEGAIYHTADWPHEPVDFSGQRVGIVGTGSSAVQAIPRIAAQAAELTVFQRTAAYVVPAYNAPLDPAYEARIKAGYADFRARNRLMRTGFGCELPMNPQSAHAASPAERDAAFEERWRVGGFGFLGTYGDLMLDASANARAAEFVRGKIRSIVHDPDTAERLCPRQAIGCKRLCVHDGYYETFNLPHVHLVDVSVATIERLTPAGLVVDGREHAVDALVLATGFDAMTGTLMRLDLRGRGDLDIRTKWRGGPLNLPWPDGRRLSEPVPHRRAGQPDGLHERDHVDRTPCRLDLRLHRRPRRKRPRDHRGQRSGRNGLGCPRHRHGAADGVLRAATRGTWAPTSRASRACSCRWSAASPPMPTIVPRWPRGVTRASLSPDYFRNSGEIRRGSARMISGKTIVSASTPSIGISMIITSFSTARRRTLAIAHEIIRHRP